ncbi:Transcription factor Dp-2 [Mortierella sp. GBA30]|nr:Transcription factor Dp-2 [Mortierella sp. GBA30]
MSPATPRSTQIHGSILRQSSSDQYTIVDSPIDYREPRGLHHTISTVLRKKYDREDHDMEHCSEQDDIREREYGANAAEEVDENDALIAAQGKRQRLSASDAALQSFGHQLSLSTSPPTYKKTQVDAIKPGSERVDRVNGRGEREEDEEEEEGRSTLASTSSSRKQSVASSLQGDDRPGSKGKKTKATAPKRLSRNSPLQASAGDAIDQLDDDGQVGAGIQSLAGRGLRIYAQRVCERVETKGSTSYNELVQELVGGKGGENAEEVTEVPGQENIRRRVYDALNVLEALDIISFDNKDIRWVGIEESRVVQAVTRRSTAAAEAQDRQPTRDGDDESEEPEDDDMEIEKLQKEVDAMKLRNELVQAQLQDQVTRHVQVLNLVKRNKRREAKEHEREERRRQRKEERRTRAFLADQDPSMTDVGPQSSSDLCEEPRRKSERHRRRRSPRMGSEKPDIPGRETGGHEAEEEMEDEDEEARQKRKQERRERRERKERRAQRRLEKEKEQDRIQLPFVVVRMPGYACQSSDSEASISVVRRVRDDQKSRKSGKSKRQCDSTGDETTMVEIQIPQQEDVSIISDTEILGDLGFNTVALDELQTMLPPNLMATVQYAVSMEDEQHHPIDSSQRASGCSRDVSSPSDGDSMMDLDATSALTNVTVRGGFEREIVRAASEGVSSTV